MGTKMKKLLKLASVVLMLFSASHATAQHKFDCPDCRGKGEVVKYCPNSKCHNGAIFCEQCDYSGTVNKTCATCNGSGEIVKYRDKPCPYCHGEKGTIKEKQEPCTHCRNGKVPTKNRRGETVWVNHTECNGTGYITTKYKAACRYCGGTGVDGQEAYKVKCDACGGKGRVTETCSQCGGKGSYVCPDCKGYGNVREKCSRCNGNGVIYTD